MKKCDMCEVRSSALVRSCARASCVAQMRRVARAIVAPCRARGECGVDF